MDLALDSCSVQRESGGATVSLYYGPAPAAPLEIRVVVSLPAGMDGVRTERVRAAVLTALLGALPEVEWPWEKGGARP